jgi:hypothetical protein
MSRGLHMWETHEEPRGRGGSKRRSRTATSSVSLITATFISRSLSVVAVREGDALT